MDLMQLQQAVMRMQQGAGGQRGGGVMGAQRLGNQPLPGTGAPGPQGMGSRGPDVLGPGGDLPGGFNPGLDPRKRRRPRPGQGRGRPIFPPGAGGQPPGMLPGENMGEPQPYQGLNEPPAGGGGGLGLADINRGMPQGVLGGIDPRMQRINRARGGGYTPL